MVSPALGQTAGMLSFQGLIKDNMGEPITGVVDLEFSIFDGETLGNLVDMDGDGVVEDVCGEDINCITGVSVTDGILSTKFGPVHPGAFDGTERWLEVSVGGSPLSRIEMATAPAAAEQVNIPLTGTPGIHVSDSGNVGIGTTSPQAKLDVNGPARTETLEITGGSPLEQALAGWGYNAFGETDVPTGTFTAVAAGWYHSLAIGGPTPEFGLLLAADSAFKPGTNTWTIMSDRRLKKNIHLLGGALDRLLELQGVSFEWIDAASQGGRYGPQIGLIADQVESVFPDWVGRDPSGYKTLTIGGFEALTTEALRQLREEKRCEIESLRAEKDAQIEALRAENESEIGNLEARLAALEKVVKQLSADHEGGTR